MLVYILLELLLYVQISRILGQEVSLPDTPEVFLKQGSIKGELKYVAGKPVYQFLGIPYAQAPVGELRFKPPKAHPGWQVSHFVDICKIFHISIVEIPLHKGQITL